MFLLGLEATRTAAAESFVVEDADVVADVSVGVMPFSPSLVVVVDDVAVGVMPLSPSFVVAAVGAAATVVVVVVDAAVAVGLFVVVV